MIRSVQPMSHTLALHSTYWCSGSSTNVWVSRSRGHLLRFLLFRPRRVRTCMELYIACPSSASEAQGGNRRGTNPLLPRGAPPRHENYTLKAPPTSSATLPLVGPDAPGR